MLKPIDIIEIELDHKRQIILTHGALRRAETEVNRARGSKPSDWMPIEIIINQAIKNGVFPADLTEILLWAGLSTEDDQLTIIAASALIRDRIYVNGKLMEACAAYWPAASKSDGGGAGDRPTTRPNGSNVGPLAESKLN